jgi:hypothetical protein
MIFSVAFTLLLMLILKSNLNIDDAQSLYYYHTFFGLSKFLEILIYFIFSTFVVFGIKGFFEMYSQKVSNMIMIISGTLLVFVIVFLSYQILFEF